MEEWGPKNISSEGNFKIFSFFFLWREKKFSVKYIYNAVFFSKFGEGHGPLSPDVGPSLTIYAAQGEKRKKKKKERWSPDITTV